MARVLFERVKAESGMHWHTDRYKCSIVDSWLHWLFRWPCYTYKAELDSADVFVIYKKFSRPYYKTVEYIRDGENIIEWLKNNISGACRVAVYRSTAYDPDYKATAIIDIKVLSVSFTSETDAMAFKLRFAI